MKTNVGLTDNPSSVGNNSSSMLTIGLPSVTGGANLLQVQNPSNQSSNINLNMNFNITNPINMAF